MPTVRCAQSRSRFWQTRQRLCEVSPGVGALAHQVKEMAAADVRFGRLALAQDPALALKISRAASPCARPPMASSLKKGKVGQGRGRCTEDVASSPHTTLPRPGDHSPCSHCLSVQITVVCVGACVHACMRVWVPASGCVCSMPVGACVCVHACVLIHVATDIPELACSHDKRCTPDLSGGTRHSGSRLSPRRRPPRHH
jgi:hypothetical protein